ncbi:hypothetical protein NE237_007144 [Protea cynaroides]|uniref:F-box domain-containing protein n=1 Tax=Protea cynaroides TaxID=273540 RepID=A0A9Q0KNW7_9MAGN|nr:hypothetical protein NE237_007144 [Protea cynaroides]
MVLKFYIFVNESFFLGKNVTKSWDRSHAMERPEGENTYRTSSRSLVLNDEDLMVKILSSLPVKVLSRFKCVSKQWNMLISDPYFISTHQGRATPDPNIIKLICGVNEAGMIMVGLFKEKEERKVTCDLIRPNYPDGFKCNSIRMVGHPCNGLICLEDWRCNGLVSHDRPLILVCNLATRNTVVISEARRNDYYLEGLGFCSSSNEFKVVRLYKKLEGYKCELFTVGQRGAWGTHPLQPSRSWRCVGDLPCQICHLGNHMCHVNGRVYWIMIPLPHSSFKHVLSLDLELEEFKIVSCPEHLPEDARDYHGIDLIELEGKLCIVFPSRDGRDIWVLKDNSNSFWSKEYQINYNIPENPYLYHLKVVGKWSRRLLLIINNSKFCYYDPRDNSLEVIKEDYLGSHLWDVSIYIENPFYTVLM